MQASPEEVYQAFIDPGIAGQWSGASAKVSGEAGAAWELWDASIIGKNVEMLPNEKIVQDWKEAGWDNHSRVTFTLTPKGNTTVVELLHENVPDNSAKSITEGWKVYYLGPMQALFEQ